MAGLVAQRTADGTFSQAEVAAAFVDLTIPPPGGLSTVLGRIASRQEALRLGGGRWRLTPLGRREVSEIVGAINPTEIEAEAVAMPGAEFAHVQHTIIPAWAAPPRWQVGIKRLLADHPFETNVFCVTRFPSEGPIADPVNEAIGVIRVTLKRYGLTVHTAADRLIEDDLLGNVGAYMWASQYGIGIIEDRVGRGINYNAVIELGGMVITGRRCALLRDRDTPTLPTDLAGQVYKSVDLDDLATVAREVDKWASTDLGLGL